VGIRRRVAGRRSRDEESSRKFTRWSTICCSPLYGRRLYTPRSSADAAVSPTLVLFPHTYQVRDFAPKLATRFSQVLISDVIAAR
jgi:hypothetical protein